MWITRPSRRETTELGNSRNPLRHKALGRRRRRVSTPASLVNPWVGGFRNDLLTRADITVLETATGRNRDPTGVGFGRGITSKQIAVVLTERGVPTKTGMLRRYAHQAVVRILSRNS